MPATTKKTTAKKTTNRKSTAKKTTAKKNTKVVEAPSLDELRQRAFEIFVERGCEPGHDFEDWLKAEAELRKN